MLNKSIRLTKEDAIGLQVIISHDPRVEKGQSEALYYVFKDAAKNIPIWADVAKTKFDNAINAETEPDFANTRTFYIEDNDFKIVLNSLRDQLHITKVRISYMTRLCIMAARMQINTEETSEMITNTPLVEVEKVRVNGVALIHKLAELLETDTEESQEKILKIMNIMEE
ncbi:hypothetical protein K2F43_08365 [Clostridium estertheticum]|uniref:hypothetical protein n=1 Tax=Clostridium estertheticum TaxID=238834 RepID=UPI001C6E9A70|nr:hypothetical protein [Clostridium estertheticum]MBW9171218.1 hypothetical protein [Clostridium estertheticum]WLC73925.1 hypothetical protein KTC99_14175 [Clostridium estertheticum]